MLLTSFLVPVKFVFLFVTGTQQAYVPSILWDPRNLIFDNETCKGGNSIQVKLEDRLHVVCPNKATVLKAIDELPSTDELYENVYITDKRRAFLNCDANSAGVKHVKSCNQPGKKEFNYLLVRFTSFGTAPMWLFKPGETYYFFGTSNGTMAGLKNKVGGNCEKRNLKLEVYICRKNDTKCDQSRINRCPLNKDNNPTTDIVEPTVAQSLKGGEKNFMDDLKSAEVVSCLVAVLIAGAFIGIVIAHVCHRRQSPKKTSLHGYERQTTVDSKSSTMTTSTTVSSRSPSFDVRNCKDQSRQNSKTGLMSDLTRTMMEKPQPSIV